MNDQWWGGVIVRGRGLAALVRGAAFSPGRCRQGALKRGTAEGRGQSDTGGWVRAEGRGKRDKGYPAPGNRAGRCPGTLKYVRFLHHGYTQGLPAAGSTAVRPLRAKVVARASLRSSFNGPYASGSGPFVFLAPAWFASSPIAQPFLCQERFSCCNSPLPNTARSRPSA